MLRRTSLILLVVVLAAMGGWGAASGAWLGEGQASAAPDSLRLRAGAEALARMTPCTVVAVSDGDSIRCEGVGRVRLLLIDTPEMDQGEWGRTARAALLELLPVGSAAHLERDVGERDQYGRLLAYVYRADGTQVNEAMVLRGFAEVVSYPPNVRHIDAMRAAKASAQRARRGLWSTEAFECAPRDHRAGRCG